MPSLFKALVGLRKAEEGPSETTRVGKASLLREPRKEAGCSEQHLACLVISTWVLEPIVEDPGCGKNLRS